MLGGLISGLIVAWILTLFGVDEFCIEVLQPFTVITLTTDHFYFGMGLIGLIGGMISEF